MMIKRRCTGPFVTALAVLAVAACGNLTAGGLTGDATVVVSGDADTLSLAAQFSVFPATKAGPAMSPNEAEGEVEGEVEADFLVFLVDEGEEAGLLGASGFVADHPLAPAIGAVVNLEARGTSGPSVMFETSGDNGWLVAEGDAQGLAQRMLECARNRDAVAAAGRAARAFVEREHALDLRLRLLDEKYSEVIAAHRGGSGTAWPPVRNAS